MSRPSLGLVYHAGGLGDFVLSLPAIQRVAQAYPDIRWAHWGPAERLTLLPGFEAAPAELARRGHTLWGERPDPVALTALQACAVALAFGGHTRPPWTRLPRVRALSVESFPSVGRTWVPFHQRQQLDALGVPPIARPWMGDWRRQLLPTQDPSCIVVHAGSGDSKKNLSAQVWEKALATLGEGLRLPIRLVVGPAEEERGGWDVLKGLAASVERCRSLGELLSVLSRARLYLGNDSGATHLAASLGIATVAFFGPSNPAIWRPLGPRVRVVTAPASCAPCTTAGVISCSRPSCLEEVDPGLLAEALHELAPGGPLIPGRQVRHN